jgi:hypothetical protein
VRICVVLTFLLAGPGAYDHSITLGEAPAFSMSSRVLTSMPDNSPGPGAYHKIRIKFVFKFTLTLLAVDYLLDFNLHIVLYLVLVKDLHTVSVVGLRQS